MRVKKLNEDPTYLIWCPACDDPHVIGPDHTYNGDEFFPEFRPSVYDWDSTGVCHFFITQGRIHYLPDCTHTLSEQTVPLPQIPDWLLDPDPDAEEPDLEPLSDIYYVAEPGDFDEDDEIAPEAPETPKIPKKDWRKKVGKHSRPDKTIENALEAGDLSLNRLEKASKRPPTEHF